MHHGIEDAVGPPLEEIRPPVFSNLEIGIGQLPVDFIHFHLIPLPQHYVSFNGRFVVGDSLRVVTHHVMCPAYARTVGLGGRSGGTDLGFYDIVGSHIVCQ